jgi:predicted nucleic acid-binding Zn ribbon protein
MKRSRRSADDPVALRDAVAAVGRELGMPAPDDLDALTREWATIVGDAVAQHAVVRSVRDGTCTIEVDEAGWATQIRYAEQQIVERARTCCRPGAVTAIRVVVRTSSGGRDQAAGRPPR